MNGSHVWFCVGYLVGLAVGLAIANASWLLEVRR